MLNAAVFGMWVVLRVLSGPGLESIGARTTATIIKTLLSQAGESERLRFHEDASISVYGAYRYAYVLNQENLTQAESHQRFIGSLEGVSKTPVPQWWQNALRAEKHPNPRSFSYPLKVQLRAITPTLKMAVGRAPNVVDAGLQLPQPNGANITLPWETVARLRASSPAKGSFAYEISERNVYTAFFSITGHPWSLTKYDSDRNTVLWSSRVWANGIRGGFTGPAGHCVSIVVGDSTVTVFGCDVRSMYCEQFETTNGQAVFRFSSWLWGVD